MVAPTCVTVAEKAWEGGTRGEGMGRREEESKRVVGGGWERSGRGVGKERVRGG